MKYTEDMTPEMIDELNLLNPDGLGLIEMFQEYLESDKTSKTYEALKYYLSFGPISDSIKKKFCEDMGLEEFFVLVRDCTNYSRPEKDFFEESHNKIMNEFCSLDVDGKYVQPEKFKITSNSSKTRFTFKTGIVLPKQKIVDEFRITPSSATKLLDSSFGTTYMKLIYNKLILDEMESNVHELENCTKFEFDIINCTYSPKYLALVGDLQLSIPPSRVTEKTLNGIQKLLEKFGAM